jgi:dihydroorotase
MRILIQNAMVVNGDNTLPQGKMDILVEDGRILRMAQGVKETADRVVDASGLCALPGLIDMHCHLRDPGFEYKDDIAHGVRSAVAGGFTGIACMPNTVPVNDNKTVTAYIRLAARQERCARVYPIGSVTKGQKGEELAEMAEMKAYGAVAFSDDGRPVDDSALMRRALEYADMFDSLIVNHCEDTRMTDEGLMNEGYTATALGLRGAPYIAETLMVSRDVIVAEYTGRRVHICHVSAAHSVDIIRQAKARGVRVTCETCPHYFTLTDEACEGFNTLAKVNPPLRSEADRQAVIAGLADGTIDAIVTDHAPHHPDEKNREFELAANGLVGFETAFGLACTQLVRPGILALSDLARLMSAAPARILGIPGGSLTEGGVADITLCDPAESWVVDPAAFHSKAKNTPFGGYALTGRAKLTMVDGRIVMENGAICG